MFGVDLFFAGLLDAGRPARRAAGVRRATLQQVLRSPHARALRTLASASRSLISRFPLAFHPLSAQRSEMHILSIAFGHVTKTHPKRMMMRTKYIVKATATGTWYAGAIVRVSLLQRRSHRTC